jgi:hypothetical protein
MPMPHTAPVPWIARVGVVFARLIGSGEKHEAVGHASRMKSQQLRMQLLWQTGKGEDSLSLEEVRKAWGQKG